MDEKKFNLVTKSNDTILELKRKLEAESSVPANMQRLIFKGKLLEDEKFVKDYYIEDESAIHFIAKLNNANNESSNNNLNDFTTHENNNINTGGIRFIRAGTSEVLPGILGSINFLPILAPERRRDSSGNFLNYIYSNLIIKFLFS